MLTGQEENQKGYISEDMVTAVLGTGYKDA